MASNDDGSVKTVKLVDPNGVECNVSTAADVVNLVYGAGYKVAEHDNAERAIEFLAEYGVHVPVGDVAEQQEAAAEAQNADVEALNREAEKAAKAPRAPKDKDN